MSNPAEFRVGSMRGVGDILLEENTVTGEGGPYDPRLVLPLKITMYARPAREMLALLALRCTLHVQQPLQERNQVGLAVTIDLSPRMDCRSLPSAPNSITREVRFPLSAGMLVLLEAHRQQAPDKVFHAQLHMVPTIVWVSETGNSVGPNGIPNGPTGELDPGLGMYSRTALLWTTEVADLSFAVPLSVWVDKVLPGLGLEGFRLIEIALPVASHFVPDGVITHFDAARRDFDLGNYRETIEKCRYVRDALAQHLGTTSAQALGDVIATEQQLPANTPIRPFWNGIWRGWWDMTNAGHHTLTLQPFSRADAHACLMTAALILEYLGQLR